MVLWQYRYCTNPAPQTLAQQCPLRRDRVHLSEQRTVLGFSPNRPWRLLMFILLIMKTDLAVY
jgi:hypothetical protein